MKTKKILVVVAILALLMVVFCIPSYATTTVRGDFDGNSVVDVDDAIYLLMHTIFSEDYPLAEETADFDGNSVVDVDDAIYLLMHTIFPEDYPISSSHQLIYVESTDATCTENGNIEYWVCSECGKFFSDSNGINEINNVIVAAHHDWREASCSAPKTCKICYTTEGEAIDHIFDQTVVNSNTQKTPASCTAAAIYYKSCACGAVSNDATQVFENGTKTAHSYQLTATVIANCTVDGSKTYKCSGCNDEYTEITDAQFGHNPVNPTRVLVTGSTCEYIIRCTCDRTGCGATIDMEERAYQHTYVASITTPATCLNAGEKTLTCSGCGDQKTEPIASDSTGHNWVKGTVNAGVRIDTCSVCSNTKSVTVYEGNSTDSTNANDLVNKEIEINDANITLDQGVVDALEGSDVVVSAEKVEGSDREDLGFSNEQLEQVGDNPIYNFTIENSDGLVSQFGEDNWVTITLPYTLADGEDVDSIAIWVINDAGELETIKATYNNGFVTFKTNHFSYYTVTKLTPKERCDLYGHIFSRYTQAGSCTVDGYDLCVCIRCNYTEKQNEVKATGHDYAITTINATCTQNGSTKYACKKCAHNYTTILTAIGHNWSVAEQKDSTCAENGYTKYACANCGEEYVETYEKLEHEYTDTVVAPTCENNGYTLRECNNCDYSIYINAAAIGHDEVAHAAKAPTCTEAGYDAYVTCSRCDYTTYAEKAALGHDEVAHDAKAPTCTEAGYDAYVTCSRCDYTTYVGKAALGHDEVAHSAKAPTCTEIGWDAYVACSRCDYSTCIEKAALGHDEIAHDAKAPTCTEIGWDAYVTCSRCDYTNYAEKLALGHNYVWIVDLEPTFEEIGLKHEECSVCHDKKNVNTEIPAMICEHSLTKVNEIQATCLENGRKEYYVCSICERLYSGADGILETTIEDSILPALGHDIKSQAAKDPTCTEIGWDAHEACSRCDYTTCVVKPMLDHVYTNETLTKNPTCSTAGEITSTCVCGKTQIKTIPTNDVHNFDKGFCTDCGVADVYYVNLVSSLKKIDGFAVKIENFSYEIREQDTSLVEAFELIGSIKQVDIAELELYFADGEIGGAATGTVVIFNGPFTNANAIYNFKAVIHEGYVYISVGYGQDVETTVQYVKVSVDSILESILYNVFGLSSQNREAFAIVIDALIPAIDTLIDLNKEQANEIIEKAFNIIFNFEILEDGSYLATLDYEKLYILNDNLANKSVSELVDFYFGEGSFESVIDFVIEIFELKPSEVPGYIDDLGLDSEELMDKLNKFAKIVGSGEDYDIRDILYDEEYADYTFGMLFFGYSDDSYLDDFNDNVVDELRERSFYDLFVSGSSEDVKYSIDNILDVICDYVSVSFTTDSDGMIIDINVIFDNFVFDSGSNQIAINFNLNININGRIEVTWWDIIEEIESNIVLPDEDMIDSQIHYNVYSGYSGSVNYKGTYYSYYDGYEVSGYHPLYDELNAIAFYADCDGWTCYSAIFAEKYIRAMFATIEVDGVKVNLIIDQNNGQVIEIVATDMNSFTAIFEDGSEKVIDFDYTKFEYKNDAIKYLCTQIAERLEGRYYPLSTSLYYYYNAELGEYAEESQHELVYEYEKFGETCEDGYILRIGCEHCDIIEEYTRYYCYTEYVDVDLKELGLCGGCVEEGRCVVCNKISYFNNYGYDDNNNSYCNWMYAGKDKDGYSMYRCTVCGAIKISGSGYYERETCQEIYKEILVYIVNGEEVYRAERENVYQSHNYKTEYEIKGETCASGYIERRTCIDCGYTYEYNYNGSCNYYYRSTNLSKLGMCYGYIEERYCNRCNTVYERYIDAYNCNWEFVEENDDGFQVYQCIYCGATKLEYVHQTEKDENCEYTRISSVIYMFNGEEIYRNEGSYKYNDHNYAQRFELIGDTCEDGYTVIRYCIDCGAQWNYGVEYEHMSVMSQLEISEFGGCAGYIDASGCTICNKIVWINDISTLECNFEKIVEDILDAEGNIIGNTLKYVCSICNCVLEDSEWTETVEPCFYKHCNSATISVGDVVVFDYYAEELSVEHNYEYSYQFIGADCSGYYLVTAVCTGCGNNYKWWDYGHKYQTTYIYLSEFGMCGGYVEHWFCDICDIERYYYYNDYCYWYHVDYTEDGSNIYRCNNCNATKIVQITEGAKDENCQFVDTTTTIFKINDEEVYRYQKNNTYTSHNYNYEYVLNGKSCDDGYTVIETCADCNYYYTYNEYGHNNKTLFYANSEQIGGCGNHYFYHYSCPCGYDGWLEYGGGSLYYDSEIGAQVCSECGFTVKESYSETTDGCNLVMTWTKTAYIGDTVVYEKSYSLVRIAHNFEYKAAYTDNGGYTLIMVCKLCGEIFESGSDFIYSGVATFDSDTNYYEIEFIPDVYGNYVISTSHGENSYVILYSVDANGYFSQINSDYGSGREDNIWLTHYLGKGVKYVYRIYYDYGYANIPYTISLENVVSGSDGCSYHDFKNGYALVEGATSCKDGVFQIYLCSCGEVKYVNLLTDSHYVDPAERYDLNDYGICGSNNYVELNGCLCNKSFCNYYLMDGCENYDERTETRVDDNGVEHKIYIYYCETCKTEVIFDTYIVVDRCAKYYYANISVSVDGVTVLDNVNGIYYQSEHNFKYEFDMNGDSCLNGYTVTITCTDCDYSYTEKRNTHYDYTIIYKFGDEFGGCYDHYFYHTACACGRDYNTGFDSDNMNFDYAANAYICDKCGFTVADTIETIVNGCVITEIYRKTASIGETQIYQTETSYVSVVHNFDYSLVLNSDGSYVLTLTCVSCGETFTSDCGYNYSDVAYPTYSYDDRYGYYYYYDFVFTPESSGRYIIESFANRDTYVELYRRTAYGGYTYLDYNDDGGTKNNFWLEYDMKAGETYIYRIRFYDRHSEGEIPFTITSSNTYVAGSEECTSHNHEIVYVFSEGAESCEDGVLKISVCSCGNVNSASLYNSHVINTEYIYLSDYGACYGTVRYENCPCKQHEVAHFYSTHGTRTTNTYVDEEGVTQYVTTYACSSCGLRYTESYYLVNNGDCTESKHVTVTVNVGAQLVLNCKYVNTYEKHNTVKSAQLMEGATNCYGGVYVIEQCQDCEYSSTSTRYSHEQVTIESFNVKDCGGACDGEFIIKSCACGENISPYFGNVLCDVYEIYSDMWIEDYIYGDQETANGGYWFDYDAYKYACAVTDPDRCGFVVRYAYYWKKTEGCTATRCLTIQIGYDEATDTCLAERTYVFENNKTTYHDYEYESTDNGWVYTCTDCGSYHSYTYTNENGLSKFEHTWVNTLDDGRTKYRYEFCEYKDGVETKRRYEVVYADGSEYWEQREYANESYSIDPFGEGSIYQREAYSNSNGSVYDYERAWTKYHGFELILLEAKQEGDSWYRYEYEYSFENFCKRITKYTNSSGADSVEEEEICGWWGSHYEVTKLSTCTQFGEAQSSCYLCGSVLGTYITYPTGHNWVLLDSGIYQCYDCNLQGIGGADGTIVMEDLTEQYGNGENYVIGYWNQSDIIFTHYISLILKQPMEDGNDEIVLYDGIDFNFVTDPYVGVWVSKDQVHTAASALGFNSDEYDVRLVFVPVGSDGSFDYAITFGDLNAGNEDIVISSDCYIIKPVVSGMCYWFEITPEEDGYWEFRIDNIGSYHEWEMIINDEYAYSWKDNTITVYLYGGETYELCVYCYDYDIYGDNRIGISFDKL